MDEYKSFMDDKGYIVNQQGNIIKLYDAVGTIPVDSDEGNSKSNGSSSIENDDDGGKEPDGPRESGKNGKWEAVDDANGRRDREESQEILFERRRDKLKMVSSQHYLLFALSTKILTLPLRNCVTTIPFAVSG